MPLSATHPGFPELLIAPVGAVVEPCRFEACAGDALLMPLCLCLTGAVAAAGRLEKAIK